MSKTWQIFRKNTDADRQPVATVHELEYHGEWMEDEYVTLTVKSPTPIKFNFGDYLTYRGEQFVIDYNPNKIKKARKNSHGEAFVYENVKLFSLARELNDIAFKDYVLNWNSPSNTNVYSSQGKFGFFAASVEDLADRLQANLDRAAGPIWTVLTPNHDRTLQRINSRVPDSLWLQYYHPGKSISQVNTNKTEGNRDINISVDNQSCRNILALSYKNFGLSYVVRNRVIIIGAPAVGVSNVFKYGKGNGLSEIGENCDDSQTVVTKLYAYGSSKNLPANYYANLHKQFYGVITDVHSKDAGRYHYAEFSLDIHYVAGLFSVRAMGPDNASYQVGWITKTSIDGIEIITRVENVSTNPWPMLRLYVEYREGNDEADEPNLNKLISYINNIAVGKHVVFTAGYDKNVWPQDHISYTNHDIYPQLLSIGNLMLPGFPDLSLHDWVTGVANGSIHSSSVSQETADTFLLLYDFSHEVMSPWIRSKKASVIGEKEGSVYFDGSSDDRPEIMPSIEGTSAGVVVTGSDVKDNGYLNETADPSFTIKVAASDVLDWKEAWNNKQEDIYIEMKSGFCTGRKFKLQQVPKLEGGNWTLKLERDQDSSLGRYFPYFENNTSHYSQVLSGDTFVVTGLQMPSSYVEEAAAQLLIRSCNVLNNIDEPKITYLPKVDEIFMARQDAEAKASNGTITSLHDTLMAGMCIHVKDEDLEMDLTTYIDNITIKENGNNGIPTYDVVLRDEKDVSDVQRAIDIIGGMSSFGEIMSPDEITRLIKQIGKQIGDANYLSKTHNDETQHLISLFGGCVVDLFMRSPEFLTGLWIEQKNSKTGETEVINDGKGFAVKKDDGGKWTIELDNAVIRSLLRAKRILADEAAIDKMTKQTIFNIGLKTLGDILLGDFKTGKSGGVITPNGDAELRNLVARLTATIGSGIYPDESDTSLRKPSLIVNGDSEFSDNLSSPEFISGFLSGKGWSIQKQTFVNSAGVEETKWSMEIDNLTVRNILRVYELIISQLRGENDNYVFAAMAEVHHYDPLTGKVWFSTEGGKMYMPFRVGDYIMVQRFQPGNDVVSGGDGYITKHYELIITDCGSGGQVDENGERLDWALFKDFTTQMVDDSTDPKHGDDAYIGTYHTEEEISNMSHPTIMGPEKLISKGDTFCRVDNESDPERKGLMSITSVGPNTPYMDVIYGLKTDPNHSLKSRFGNLEGINTDLFGWLEGFGAYINNLYGVGKFFNAQTGESMESRIEATNERMRSVYKETLYDVGDSENKVSNGFFQDDFEDWTPVDINGAALAEAPEMSVSRTYTDPNTGQQTADWRMEHANGDNQVAIKSGETDGGYAVPLLMNGLQLQIQKTLKAELSDVGGVRMLHLRNSGVSQDFLQVDENNSHKKLAVDDNEFEDPKNELNKQPEYEKATYKYWEDYYRDWLRKEYGYNDLKIEEYVRKSNAVEWINNQVDVWTTYYLNQVDHLTSTESEPDKLYLGIRILPLTEGRLRVGFLTKDGSFNEYQNSKQCFSKWYPAARDSMKWELATWNDHPEDEGGAWYYPCDTDKTRKTGKLFVGYTGECYIRFVVLSNDPTDELEHEYETLFEQNSRRIRMQAKKDEKEFANWVIQYNVIGQRVTDNRNLADHALKDILGIEYDEDSGTYIFPKDWFDPNYTYGSWLIHTKSRIDFLFTKFDEYGNLIGYSNHTQTADYISDIIASGSTYPTWAVNCLNFAKSFLRFSNRYYDNNVLKNGAWLTATADYALSASELTTIKAQFQSNGDIQQKYTAAANKISEIPSDIGDLGGTNGKISDPEGRMLIVNYFNRVVALRYSIVKTSINSLSADGSSNINMNNSTFLGLKNLEIPQMEQACRELVAMIVNRYGEEKLGNKIQVVQEGFKAYQDSLDDAIKEAYAGQNVDFVSWASDTALSSVQAKAIIDKDTGKIKTESIQSQTAELIESAINNYGDGKFTDYTQTDNGFESFIVCLANDRKNFSEYKIAQNNVKEYLEDNILNKSEYEAVKKLRMSLESDYKDVVATYTKIHDNANLTGKDNDQNTVKGKIKKAYDALSTAYTTLINSIDTLLTKYEEAISGNSATSITITVPANLKTSINSNFTTFNTKLEDYKKALDDASYDINKATAQVLVDTLKNIINPDVLPDKNKEYTYASFKSETATKFAQIYGKWDVNEDGTLGGLRGYSTTEQTANAIESAVTTLGETMQNDIDTLIGKINEDISAINSSLDSLTGDQGDIGDSFTSYVIQTDKKIANIVGKWNTDAEGNITTLKEYSTTVQTSNLIQSSVSSLEKKVIDLSDINKWERKTTDENVGGVFEDRTSSNPTGIKIAAANRILYRDLIPVTKFAAIAIESGYDVFFVYFDSSGKVCSKTGSGWKSLPKKDDNVTSKVISISPNSDSLPSDLAYIGLLLRKGSPSVDSEIYVTDIPSTGIMLVDSKIADVSFVNQTAMSISTTVTNNMNAANDAFKTLTDNLKAEETAREEAINGLKDDFDKFEDDYTATWFYQNRDLLALMAAEFDGDGKIKGYADLKVSVDDISTTVTNNKNDADSALSALNNETIPALEESIVAAINSAGEAKDIAESSATWIDQNKDAVLVAAGAFNEDGTLKNASGFLTEDNFSTLFSTAYTNTYRDPSEWEQGSVRVGSNSEYDDMKVNSNTSIRMATLQPVSGGTYFYLNEGYNLYVYFFNSIKNYIGNASSSYTNSGNRGIYVPDGSKYCAVRIVKNEADSFTPKEFSSSGFRMSDIEVATMAEISASVAWESDGNGGMQLKSNIKLSADHITQVANNIDINANNINWIVTGGWGISNGEYNTLWFDEYGNMSIAGTLTQGEITGNVNVGTGTKKMVIEPREDGARLVGKDGNTEVLTLGFNSYENSYVPSLFLTAPNGTNYQDSVIRIVSCPDFAEVMAEAAGNTGSYHIIRMIASPRDGYATIQCNAWPSSNQNLESGMVYVQNGYLRVR